MNVHLRLRRITLACAMLTGLTLIAGCGGGDSTTVSGVGSGGTGAFSTGAIRGLGSIVVNGVRYDDSAATITDDSGQRSDSTQLKLGVVVDVQGDAIVTPATGLPTSKASTVTFRSEIKGPVTAVNTAAGTLTVLGQNVVVSASTVFDTNLPAGLGAVAVGRLVEVYGFVDAAGTFQATRIEREDSATSYKLRGPISALDSTAKTFRIGTAVIDYGSLSLPAGLANGQTVRVDLATTPNAQGRWVATSLNNATGLPSTASTAASVELEGVITSLASSRSFVVNGITVNASNVASLPGNLAVGSRVEIKGRLENGVLTATRVEREDSSSSSFEIKGNIALLDLTAKTFEIRGVLIDYANARFKDGTAANLSAGVRVEVKGGLNATGTVLTATELEFKGLDDVGSSSSGVAKYEVKGTISALNSTTKTFVVRGITVNYATARFEDGTVANLVNGVSVEAEGVVSAAVLVATKVDFESSSGSTGGSSGASVEIEGSITALDTTARTFTVGGVVVAYGSATFKDGTAANLRVGAKVEVKGNAPVNGVVTATQVEFDD